MPLAPEIAGLLDRMADDPRFERPAGGSSVEAARRGHEFDAATLCPPAERAEVGAVRDLVIPGPVVPLPARVYRPPARGGAVPTLLWLHGGGWSTGSLDTADIIARQLCAEAGVVVVTVAYRLAPEAPWPAGPQDCTAALHWAAGNIASLGGDPDRLCVGGDSAGGNLSAVLALASREDGPRLAAQLLVYPATDLDPSPELYPSRKECGAGYHLEMPDVLWCFGNYLSGGGDPHDARVSPLRAPDLAGAPPAIVVTADYDPLRDEGEAYADALDAAGVPVVRHRLPGLIHGSLDMLGVSPTARQALTGIAASLASMLRSGTG
ncbi:acetylhydrolase [Microtetraspora sp. NBRC 13810]|uniref:alpha/beta hydrolase n=1 Tax=Microtetraspora sp. NBRC 13810 TaxID=3030990 RepID=UPI0024A38F10|nr:alpha/beta hydrolase [Microtetraspora sp. NBRC 13810]GLW07065.1 acetylhydrolase [Microtetraspora sp. NBRC 13810]